MERKKRNNLIIALLILSVVLLISAFYLKSLLIIERQEIPIHLTIGTVPGFNLTNTSLEFGVLRKGFVSEKSLTLYNKYNIPVIVELASKGDAAVFLVYDSYTKLGPKESKTINISTIDLGDEPNGEYRGTMEITFKRARN